MIKGYCAMAGDIIHPGHINFLKTCKFFCDWLVVGVMTDEAIEGYKGKKPIMTYTERVVIIENIKVFDEISPQNTFEYSSIMLHSPFKPDIIFDSIEHKRETGVTERMLIKYTEGISSTIIKERIRKAK